jgi:hypothetical protein
MADATISDGLGGQIDVDTITLLGGEEVQTVHWVFASEGGAAVAVLKAEDTAHTSGDYLMPIGVVRRDTASALAGDGDYIPLTVDDEGKLWVNIAEAVAAARTTDSIAVALQSDAIMDGLTVATPGRAIIDAATSGDNTLVAAQGSGLAVRVHACMLMASGTVTARFESGAGGTALSGQIQMTAQTGFSLDFSPIPWMVTGDNTLLNLELSGAVSVDGLLIYSVA